MHTKWNHKVVLLTVITFLAATFAMSASWSKGLGLFASAASESRAGETPLVVLYDQNNNAGSQSTSSQNFEAAFDNFDDFLGDDFVVPGMRCEHAVFTVFRNSHNAHAGDADE